MSNKGQRYRGNALKAILTASETLSCEQRNLIEKAFGAPVFDWYGSAERVVLIFTCEKGKYHVNPEFGYVEFMPSQDGKHEIIATGLHNWLMPLIRYKINDTVILEDANFSCPCGRHLPVVKEICGRRDDYIKTSDGRMVGRLTHIFKDVRNIAEAQIRQDDLREVIILVVPFSGFNRRDEKRILSNARARLGKQMKISVETVRNIPRTESGKFRTVICSV